MQSVATGNIKHVSENLFQGDLLHFQEQYKFIIKYFVYNLIPTCSFKDKNAYFNSITKRHCIK